MHHQGTFHGNGLGLVIVEKYSTSEAPSGCSAGLDDGVRCPRDRQFYRVRVGLGNLIFVAHEWDVVQK